MKNKVPLILFLVIIVALVGLALFLNTQIAGMRQDLDVERYNRLTAEENRAAAAGRVRTLEAQLDASNKKIENIQSILSQKEATAQELQTQLNEVQENKKQMGNELTSEQAQP